MPQLYGSPTNSSTPAVSSSSHGNRLAASGLSSSGETETESSTASSADGTYNRLERIQALQMRTQSRKDPSAPMMASSAVALANGSAKTDHMIPGSAVDLKANHQRSAGINTSTSSSSTTTNSGSHLHLNAHSTAYTSNDTRQTVLMWSSSAPVAAPHLQQCPTNSDPATAVSMVANDLSPADYNSGITFHPKSIH